jgi:hypothetical protein
MFARRGQCFTTTKYITKLVKSDGPDNEIREIPDVIRRRIEDGKVTDENYTFTDGCGRISPELAKMIDAKFNLYQCSAY